MLTKRSAVIVYQGAAIANDISVYNLPQRALFEYVSGDQMDKILRLFKHFECSLRSVNITISTEITLGQSIK